MAPPEKYPLPMYARYFGLKHPPFSIAPDPRYLFMSERHREALAHLLYGVRGGGGFVLLTGEIGAGKTTVCRCFLEQIPKRCNVAYIFNPKLTVEELLKSICAEFRIPFEHPGPNAPTVKDYVDALNEFLLRTHAVGQNNVLIIDEAQNLSADVLEQLRLLTNLETNERKLLQIVLIGQPELRTMLAKPGLQQLAQRVIARYHLEALSEPETLRYVRHRLNVAGLSRAVPFDRPALKRIYVYSHGVPRRINLICDRALLGAYANGKTIVDRQTVEMAAREVLDLPDFNAATRPNYERIATLGFGIAAGAALVGAVALALDRGEHAAAPPPTAVVGTISTVATTSTSPAPPDAPPIATPADVPAFDLATGFASLASAEKDSWREMAKAWDVSIGDGDPCQVPLKQSVRCFRGSNSTLALIRQLDRPVLLTLRDGSNRPAYAYLTGLSTQNATLRVSGAAKSVPLVSLADYWRGEFATYWRTPPDYSGTITDSKGPTAHWLALQLATARGDPRPIAGRLDDASLRAGIHAFQLTQGLPSDGVAGPITLMQLNRVIGVDEPHLQTEK
ncbi:MAG TPA: AAA family ATPase [Burkholderiaceae bacterium]|nr:AAA family ATPase [Burkholderiaceae bacterium]